jgi:xylulose-5-phosphate/fructose-6-phosphate phosphoketolase
VLNRLDRFHLVQAVIDWLPETGAAGAKLRALMQDKLAQHSAYIRLHGQDMPEIRDWQWICNPENVTG